ncbi:MAG: succinate dehydrogenase assembly factor 2 [Pseudomonadota bacterium]
MADDLTNRRKRLSYRCWHRGTKELDLLIGSFADRYLGELDGRQLDDLEALLRVPEPILYDWLLGKSQPPADYDSEVTRLLLAFQFKPPLQS